MQKQSDIMKKKLIAIKKESLRLEKTLSENLNAGIKIIMLNETINKDYLEAYKAGDDIKVSVLRLIKSAIKNAEISNKGELSDSDIVKILKKEVNNRKETILTYENAGRSEAAEKENEELKIIKQYLPIEMSDDELKKKVIEIINELPESDRGNIGKIIGAVLKKEPSADGSSVSQIVREYLK